MEAGGHRESPYMDWEKMEKGPRLEIKPIHAALVTLKLMKQNPYLCHFCSSLFLPSFSFSQINYCCSFSTSPLQVWIPAADAIVTGQFKLSKT